MLKRIAISALLFTAVACSGGPQNLNQGLAGDLSQITSEQWQALSQRTIYFGHQSVGNNILEAVRELVAEKPQIPLRIISGASAASAGIHGLLGRLTRPMRNALRTQYNDMLRAAYAGREPIFDLAAVESTRADGTREYGTSHGQPVYALAREWSADDGHLNALGRRRAPKQLLITLASLPKSADVALQK